jgi:hypothetical protein
LAIVSSNVAYQCGHSITRRMEVERWMVVPWPLGQRPRRFDLMSDAALDDALNIGRRRDGVLRSVDGLYWRAIPGNDPAHAVLPITGKAGSDWSYAGIAIAGPVIGGALAGLAMRVMHF